MEFLDQKYPNYPYLINDGRPFVLNMARDELHMATPTSQLYCADVRFAYTDTFFGFYTHHSGPQYILCTQTQLRCK